MGRGVCAVAEKVTTRRSQQESIAMRKAAPRKSIPACSTLTEKSLEEAFYPPRFRRKPAEHPETTPVKGLRAKCPPPVTGCLRCLHFQGPAARPRPRVILLTVHICCVACPRWTLCLAWNIAVSLFDTTIHIIYIIHKSTIPQSFSTSSRCSLA